jgi:hypothetical protein
MHETKSGIETPTDPPKEKLEAPVKIYPGSSKLGKREPQILSGPAEDGFQGHGRRRK